jgi:(1->4)-alpha-D-glucan 1-alpha-D-glucosylmutase
MSEANQGDFRQNDSANPPPRATYRLQMHRGFDFDQARAILPYLAELGVSHIYLSPIQTSQPGSMHGYDIVDHGAINPELGGLEGFYRFSDASKAAGLFLVVDIVPNHAGIGGSHNAWWLSVLEWGPLSPFAHVFDIDWERPGARGKLVAPFLGSPYGEALAAGEIRLAFDAKTGSFSVWHHEHQFPICPIDYPVILDRAAAILETTDDGVALQRVCEALGEMSEAIAPGEATPENANQLKSRLAALATDRPPIASALDRVLVEFNGAAGDAASFGLLHSLLERQHYRLAFWRVTESELNFRRFFEITTLAGLRVEDPDVFERTHRLIFRLIAEKRIDGLRVDHVDGLADPEEYLERLQGVVGPRFYIVVEKILEHGEILRKWPISGTTGYDALHVLDGLFVDGGSEAVFTRDRRRYTGMSMHFDDELRRIKTAMLRRSFGSEFDALVENLKTVADASPYTRDFTRPALARVVGGMISWLPMYRSYLTDDEIDSEDRELVTDTSANLALALEFPDLPVLDFFVFVLLGAFENDKLSLDRERVGKVRRQFQQLSGPVMAKSLEDTLFYRDTRLIALDEVGGDPTRFGASPEEFHAGNLARLRSWPHAMIATETHDSKRGEDMRARLVALTEVPREWEKTVELWKAVVADYSGPKPDESDLYFILQTIVGAWPLELLGAPDPQSIAAFVERLDAYFLKSFREAKRRSSWVDPNISYEDAVRDLVTAVFSLEGRFLGEATPFVQKLAHVGMLNSLSRLVLKCTVPGVPDTYQGTEFWDFSLVDPDNRRPVDYDERTRALGGGSPVELIESWMDGRVKQELLRRLLADRAEAPELYAYGDYLDLSPSGEGSRHVVGFSRNWRGDSRVIVAGRLLSKFGQGRESVLSKTSLPIPAGRWRDLLTGAEWNFDSAQIDLGELLSPLPTAVLQPIDAGS